MRHGTSDACMVCAHAHESLARFYRKFGKC
jgi:hypothetical protein